MEEDKRAPRRRHSAQLKSQVLAECAQQGLSVAKVAMAHGLNANLVHKWRRATGAATLRPAGLALTQDSSGGFIALTMPPQSAPAAPAEIRIELRRSATTMKITWPIAAAPDCAAWMRELLR